ncbi:FUSC family protein [Clostridium botulinum]|uniref:FUSC family protein n=1 Tax=Clostridium botulinum TaxID=1491 RepID=A0A0L9YBV8_CLOBO|nr:MULTISPECIES: aromatic acid exporter family protein [Clostridium]ACD50991.1 conserved hypothetical protein [Clostridium botulinum E3 str. Alaska E43]AJF28215.1 membrane protein [Clostridium botulinum]AJF31275.1 membrane protein [Clostridium botulinum]KAI3349599.1 aromatic acid exporter family protein [Clostridium botulinum]KOM89327.1 membrane protein [Clostridium botulinum]
MKNLKLPKIGLRNLKTALAVSLCMFIFQVFHRQDSFYACIASVVCMKDTVSNSFTMGKNRLIGTCLGGLIGLLVIFLSITFPFLYKITPIVTGIGIIFSIYLCTLLNKSASVIICCIVFISIMVNHHSGPGSYIYAIMRCIDTTIGIIIAVVINKFVHPPKEKNL